MLPMIRQKNKDSPQTKPSLSKIDGESQKFGWVNLSENAILSVKVNVNLRINRLGALTSCQTLFWISVRTFLNELTFESVNSKAESPPQCSGPSNQLKT